MEFFEVLLILIFIGLPLIEGILKRRRAAGETEPGPGDAPRPHHPYPDRPSRPQPRPAQEDDDEAAAAMVPDDLWELLTGERRPPGGAAGGAPREEAGWAEPEPLEEAGIAVEEEPVWEPEPWEPEPEDRESPVYREPESLEYVGPEAVSLETAPPPAEVRHRLFHQKVDAFDLPPERRRRAPATGIRRALADPAGLRDAIVLAEVLGPPKGLGDQPGLRPLAD